MKMAMIRNRKNEKYFSEEEVRKHNSEDDCWVIEKKEIYDVTAFLKTHPGGAELILKHAGRDVTDILQDENSHVHSLNAYTLLNQYRIGKVSGINNNEHELRDENLQGFCMDGYKEELLDWDHGLVLQVHKLGKDYMKWVNSPVNRKLKLFDSNIVEFFSKTPWFVIPLVWLPVVLLFSILAVQELYATTGWMFAEDQQYSVLHSVLAVTIFTLSFAVGLPMWTFIEYFLHRYLFHLEPKGDNPFLITLHFFLHGQHHKVPFDGNRLVFPPVAASVFVLIFFKSLTALCPGGFGCAAFAGGMLGYITYDLLHYYFHHGSPSRGSYLHSLKYNHILHHFDDHDTGFGISTKFWDYPFGTVNKKLNR